MSNFCSTFSKFGLSDPSWSEVQFFINLLNKQLICCQESVFCQHVDGLKAFVIKFMIIMSKVLIIIVVNDDLSLIEVDIFRTFVLHHSKEKLLLKQMKQLIITILYSNMKYMMTRNGMQGI